MTRIADSLNKVIKRTKPWVYGGEVKLIPAVPAETVRAGLPHYLTDQTKKMNREAMAKLLLEGDDDDR